MAQSGVTTFLAMYRCLFKSLRVRSSTDNNVHKNDSFPMWPGAFRTGYDRHLENVKS